MIKCNVEKAKPAVKQGQKTMGLENKIARLPSIVTSFDFFHLFLILEQGKYMMLKAYISLIFGILLSGCSGGSATYSSVLSPLGSEEMRRSSPFTAPLIDSSVKQAYLSAINEARRHSHTCGSRGSFGGTTPLRWNDSLYKAAYEHSYDLAQSDTFDHKGSGTPTDHTSEVLRLQRGSTFKERIVNNGYAQPKAISENITAGTLRDTAKKAVDAWLASDGHCANLMNPDFKEVGMAHVSNADTTYKHYWTQNLAKSR